MIDLLVSFFTAYILHKNLDRKAQEVLLTVEKDVKSNLEETEILLTMASNSVLYMLMQGGNQKTGNKRIWRRVVFHGIGQANYGQADKMAEVKNVTSKKTLLYLQNRFLWSK